MEIFLDAPIATVMKIDLYHMMLCSIIYRWRCGRRFLGFRRIIKVPYIRVPCMINLCVRVLVIYRMLLEMKGQFWLGRICKFSVLVVLVRVGNGLSRAVPGLVQVWSIENYQDSGMV